MDKPAMNRPTISMEMCTAPVWIAQPSLISSGDQDLIRGISINLPMVAIKLPI
jgi:hypothetical protein